MAEAIPDLLDILYKINKIQRQNDGNGNGPAAFELAADRIESKNQTIFRGNTCQITGGLISVMNRLNEFVDANAVPVVNDLSSNEIKIQVQPNRFNEVTIRVVGTKKQTYNACCSIVTNIGSLLIIPIFFKTCMWWKKIAYPKYEVDLGFYRLLGNFLRAKNCRTLHLIVADNAFNAQKATTLFESLEGSSLRGVTFKNLALACNHRQNEADEFTNNMRRIKQLPFSSQIQWGEICM